MKEVIQVEDRYYILAASDRAAECLRVLKHGETFAIFDCHGDIQPIGLGEQGIFHEGTRFLSKLELRFAGERPLLLGSTINKQNELLAVDLMNPDFTADGHQVRRDAVHVFRSKFIWKGNCYEQLRLTNFSLEPLEIPFSLSFDNDFADIFEVRGTRREARGTFRPPEYSGSTAVLSYDGRDGVLRTTRLDFHPPPAGLSDSEATYRVALKPKESATFCITVTCACRECESFCGSYEQALAESRESLYEFKNDYCEIVTDDDHFNTLLARSQSDLIMMTTCTESGAYPYAGVPWFSTPFGRDGILTALEMLWANPDMARGVLTFLAHTQADRIDAENDAEPGKILHETRKGEMAALREIPFGFYYGSVDSTPLFIVLAGAYYERSGDRDFIAGIWPNVLRALEWIDTYGDADGDGFVEYARHSHEGLVQQGWKDSEDSVFHADGTLAKAPIALCEVQGYVYEAKVRAAEMATALGETERAAVLREQASTLQRRFHEAFWCEDLSVYALALDGDKRPCRVRSSNTGHCLFSGIAAPEHAGLISASLLSDIFFTGWGIRTIASTEQRYNPMSYHNGSIWPHDNALIAAGLARYGYTEKAIDVLQGIFDASQAMELHRLPELFCGFKRRDDFSPILYPVACAPQAWAAASVYLMLQGCIGLSIDAVSKRVRFNFPVLPPFLNEVRIDNLRVGADASVDVVLKRYNGDVTVSVVRKQGPVEVMIVK
ncbi:amylo-alpha-1,6-glucosidase [Geobacter sp. SVR]|uniref:amylo-alpha-1,6-glucosidase n=1 Tax=Geobacter sp. SVR TaxID=2495594 RepID=UPI00143EFE7C|nr:amylo-alpha-1,6-glucosidase [Geobacter sp. SVR]BCS52550.1 amylo-alpha-1,6-glucosidase [Geobacter sp. SVR]GCF84012.1 amylo-alpha-1,6-glucosidase [Geobacter sp. SVR]